MPPARRVLLLVAACALASGCGSTDTTALPPGPAPPQHATLDWVEHFPAEGPALVVTAQGFEVTPTGWRAEIGLENRTVATWSVIESPATSFGVMLFTTDRVAEVEARNRDGDLPGLRTARTFDPPLPGTPPPGRSWHGTIAAPGPLAAGLYVRIVFGRLVAEGDRPAGMPAEVTWITDNAYRLKPGAAA
jgi:hypothetical protein